MAFHVHVRVSCFLLFHVVADCESDRVGGGVMRLREETALRLMDEEIDQLSARVRELEQSIRKRYKSVQDMRVSANKTDDAIKAIKNMKTEISRTKTMIKRKQNERNRKAKAVRE